MIRQIGGRKTKIRDYCRNVKGFKGIQLTWDMTDGVPTGKELSYSKGEWEKYSVQWQNNPQ